MKLNIQKGIKVVLPLLVVAVMVFGLLPTSAHAAARDPIKVSEHVTDVVIDGNIKSVTFSFPDIKPLTNIWPQGQGLAKEFFYGDYSYLLPSGSFGLSSRTFFGGVEAYVNNAAPLTGIFDVSDIMPGAPITLTMSFRYNFWFDPDHPEVSVTAGHGYFSYDKDGKYLGQYYGERRVIDFPYGGEMGFVFSTNTDFTLPNDVYYILPFTSLSFTFAQLGADDYLSYEVTGQGFSMSTDINMIYEDSETGKQIAEKLDEIIDGPSDVTGDVDDIVGGTTDQKDKVNNLIGQMGQMQKPNVNTIKPNLSAVVNPASSQMLAASVGNIVENPFVLSLLTITATILLVSFVLFGKKR